MPGLHTGGHPDDHLPLSHDDLSTITYTGDVTSMVDPDAKTWTYTYDTYGDQARLPILSATRQPTPTTTWMAAHHGQPKGNAAGAEHPSQYTTKLQLRRSRRRDQTTDPLGHTTINTYDADHNLTTATDANGHMTSYIYDLANEQTAVTPRPDGTTTLTTYWPDGTVKAQIDGAGHCHVLRLRRRLARRASVTDPLGQVTSYTYDAAGNLLTTTEAANGKSHHQRL